MRERVMRGKRRYFEGLGGGNAFVEGEEEEVDHVHYSRDFSTLR